MPTPASIITRVAALMNDAVQDVYTNTACLPYYNIALTDCQEEFQLNSIPSTQKTSAAIAVDAGVVEISPTTTPALPTDLVEIEQLWESPRDEDRWTPMVRREFIPHYMENVQTSYFQIWSFTEEKLNFPPSTIDEDLKIDYVRDLFAAATIGTINTSIGVLRTESYLTYRTAALCAYFIGENENRSAALQNEAERALGRSTGISIKGRQAIKTRRLPFRAGYKQRTMT